MPEPLTAEPKEAKTDTRTGKEMAIERYMERYLGNAIHLFQNLLALLIFVAAVMTAWDTTMREFPRLLQTGNEYSVLRQIIESILLIAIAAELGLLLLFHRATAVVEVVLFVIAHKLVSPEITVTGLLLGTLSIIALIVTRVYFLPGKPK